MPEGNTPATSGSKKTYYIIGGVAILILIGWFLMRGADSMMGAATGTDVDQSMDGSTTYTDQEGNTATVGGTSMPDSWPSDAPQNFAGAVIAYSGTSNPQTGQAGSAVSYTVRASLSSVTDYYKQQLASSGWTVQATASVGGATVVSATKDTRTFGAYIVDTQNGSVAVTAGISM